MCCNCFAEFPLYSVIFRLLLAVGRDCWKRGQLQSVEGGGCRWPVLLLYLLLMVEGDNAVDGGS
jgi:hypothetical protein